MSLIYTIAFICKNEEKTLPKLLDSMKPFFYAGGKAIAIDTGSTDNTVKICKDYGVEIQERGDEFFWKLNEDEKQKFKELVGETEYHNWEQRFPDFGFFNYAAARNAVAQIAPTDWILTVDCDEVFTKFDPLYVDYWVRTSAIQDMASFQFIWARNPSGGEVINNTMRIFNKKASQWVRYVHEHIDGNGSGIKGKAITLSMDKIFMEHFQNQEEVSTNIRKSRMFGLFKDYLDNPTNGRASHYLGRELMYFNSWKAAIKLFEINLESEPWDVQRMSSCIFKGDCYIQLKDEQNAVRSYYQAWEEYDKTRLSSMRLANLYYLKNDYYKAKTWANIALSCPFRIDFLEQPENYRHLPHEILYWAYYWLGDRDESKKQFKKCVEYYPNNPKYISDAKFFG